MSRYTPVFAMLVVISTSTVTFADSVQLDSHADKSIRRFVRAYTAVSEDLDAVMDFYSESESLTKVLLDEGRIVKGRDAVKKLYDTYFSKNKKDEARYKTTIKTQQFPGCWNSRENERFCGSCS